MNWSKDRPIPHQKDPVDSLPDAQRAVGPFKVSSPPIEWNASSLSC